MPINIKGCEHIVKCTYHNRGACSKKALLMKRWRSIHCALVGIIIGKGSTAPLLKARVHLNLIEILGSLKRD